MPSRYDIQNSDVEKLLAEGKTIAEVARALGCSDMVVFNVKSGKRKQPPMPQRHVKGFKRGAGKCSCCNLAPTMPGNRWLCKDCYSEASTDLSPAICYASMG